MPDLLQAALADYGIAAIDERSPDAWRVFFESPAERDRAAADLPGHFPDLALEPVDVPDEDWAARSQSDLRAIRIGNLVVAPPWDLPDEGDPPYRSGHESGAPTVVVIQPSMGFGTGHHATTRLCLVALQQFDLHASTVLDIGTGSGVLGIAATLLGAASVMAIDNDPDAVQSARENAARNDAAVDIRVADLSNLALPAFDFVVANLTGVQLVQSAGRLQVLGTARGVLILSGFTSSEEPAVVAAFPRLRVLNRSQEDEWVCLTLRHEAAFQ